MLNLNNPSTFFSLVRNPGLVQAKTTSLNPNINTAKIEAIRKQLRIAKSQLAIAQAEIESAIAAEKQILDQIAYLNVISPIEGVVTACSIEPGAVVGSGRTLLTLINPCHCPNHLRHHSINSKYQ